MDSWACEMLHPCNTTYGSSAQAIGHKIGHFMSTSAFIALNSVDFCQRYIYGYQVAKVVKPLVSMEQFIKAWAIIQFVVTIYIACFVPEKDPVLAA